MDYKEYLKSVKSNCVFTTDKAKYLSIGTDSEKNYWFIVSKCWDNDIEYNPVPVYSKDDTILYGAFVLMRKTKNGDKLKVVNVERRYCESLWIPFMPKARRKEWNKTNERKSADHQKIIE